MKKYTTKQIKDYLEGFKIMNLKGEFIDEYNTALINAIHDIDDKQDGIEAYCKRKENK
jgi:hypothetical protein